MNVEKYRVAFREKIIPNSYSAKVHIALFIVFQLTATYWSFSKIHWGLESIVWIVLSLFWASFALYWVHRLVLHKKVIGFNWAYKMHRWHHTFYQKNHMHYDQLNDVYMLLMPPWLQLIYFVVYLPILSICLSFFLSAHFIDHFMFTLIIWYGLYEFIHWTEHLAPTHSIMKWRLFKNMRLHHMKHHEAEFMDQHNFGIVDSTQDYLWRSKA